MGFRPIQTGYPLILASASPRRKRLLEQIGLPFRTHPSDMDENHSGDPVVDMKNLAGEKAKAVLPEINGHWTLGADTVVVIDGKILGKPADHSDALLMLRGLSGKEHRVITGFAVMDPSGRRAHSETVTTLVKMKHLTDKEIRAYIATKEPFGKAGSYAIQGIGAFMVEAISGSYTKVVGLPLCALIKALFSTGARTDFPL